MKVPGTKGVLIRGSDGVVRFFDEEFGTGGDSLISRAEMVAWLREQAQRWQDLTPSRSRLNEAADALENGEES